MTAKRLVIIGNQAFAMRNFRGPLISALVERRIEVFALAPDYTDADRAAVRALGGVPLDFPLRRASISPLHDLRTLGSLVSQLSDLRPEIVLSFSAKPSVYGTLAAAMSSVPRRYALIEGLGHAFIEAEGSRPSLLRSIVSGLYRFSLARATAVLFLNDDDRQEFVTHRLVQASKATIVGAIGVDLAKWRSTTPVLDPITFLFVGRLLREKGVLEFAEAARRIKQTNPEVRFTALGAPDANPSSLTAEQAKVWEQEGIIEWHGHVDVRPWLEKSSVFVLPSYREGVPRSTQEALAMAKPVITTDVPGCRETVLDNENGLLIPPRSVDALERAMRAFVENPAMIAPMGEASRRLAERKFDVQQATARMLAAMGI